MLRKGRFRWILAIGLCTLAALLIVPVVLQPQAMERTEIFSGVYLTVRDLPRTSHGSGKVMIAEVHWDTPGVSISNREYDYPVNPADPDAPHYQLAFADWALAKEQTSLLINTAIYQPDPIYRILPGLPVRSLDTLVVEGRVSHIHPHSYLLYWDTSMEAHLLRTKPPDQTSLGNAQTGIGMGGMQVVDGQPAYEAIEDRERVFPRTFIGIDPGRRILYLLAFENASAYRMIETAVEAGVVTGGQMDSGRSTNFLTGRSAAAVGPHRGIRGWRPLGPYLVIRADPVN